MLWKSECQKLASSAASAVICSLLTTVNMSFSNTARGPFMVSNLTLHSLVPSILVFIQVMEDLGLLSGAKLVGVSEFTEAELRQLMKQ